MLHVPKAVDPLERLANRLGLTREPSGRMIDDVMKTVCTRLSVLQTAGKTRKLEEWCRSGAFLDAALELVALELPGWTVRRIVRDEEQWFCSLSRSPNLPEELDDAIEASHETPAMAILSALVQAKRVAPVPAQAVTTKPRHALADCHRVSCENFS